MSEFDPQRRNFVRGFGTMLEDAQGRRVYDAVSSIWTTIHGHCHPRIVGAIARQAATLDHATLLGATNPLAEELAERLCALTGMDRVFFASDGASAIEAAIKMTLQYWQNAGQPQRTRFVRLRGGYHGDTVGAMSLSDIALFKSRFGKVTFSTRTFDDSKPLGPDVAAVIVEPLIQAAAGMRLVPARAYERLKNVKPILICDEIATGFGRTGTMFALEQVAAPQWDIVCVGKGLSGGALALSATLVRRHVFDAFLGERESLVHFFHGHSYAGNPIACAAALASLALFGEEKTLERARAIAKRVAANGEALRTHPLVRDVRQAGTMAGIELNTPGPPIADALYDAGHFTRPIGNVIQFVPPLSSADAEVDLFFEALLVILSEDRPERSRRAG
jgi:adenosylmethionine-8-amino-7-oxononanoate aminotransferase